MKKTMYKVVSYIHGEYYSVSSYSSLSYAIGETTLPVFGKIFVFDKLSDARSFRSMSKPTAILIGVAENPHKLNLIPIMESDDEKFWKLRENKKKVIGAMKLMDTPIGTYIVDSFKPFEAIERRS
jgi:hypothetical protein